MALKYYLYLDDKGKAEEAARRGEPVEISVMDVDEMLWFETKSLISHQPMEGGGVTALMGPFGTPAEEGNWYVKIVEKLPGLLEED